MLTHVHETRNAGIRYVYLGALSEPQMERYATRVGEMFAAYGPKTGMVADTYGSANMSTLATYSQYAELGGSSPIAYVVHTRHALTHTHTWW